MPQQTWRERAAPVIARAIADGRAAGLDGRALSRHIQAFYPFGPRANFPYKVWLDEIDRQLGRKKRVRTRRPESPDQKALF